MKLNAFANQSNFSFGTHTPIDHLKLVLHNANVKKLYVNAKYDFLSIYL